MLFRIAGAKLRAIFAIDKKIVLRCGYNFYAVVSIIFTKKNREIERETSPLPVFHALLRAAFMPPAVQRRPY
jgi:hypothetical protein